MAQPILMTEDYWANSQFSVVRYTGSMRWNGVAYTSAIKKAGFKWDGGYGHKQLDENKTMQYYKHESRLRVWYKAEDIIFECHCVYYLHQLQNAYYMATGEELEDNLKIIEKNEKCNKSYKICYSGSTISQYWVI